jgi:hypothetical protein
MIVDSQDFNSSPTETCMKTELCTAFLPLAAPSVPTWDWNRGVASWLTNEQLPARKIRCATGTERDAFVLLDCAITTRVLCCHVCFVARPNLEPLWSPDRATRSFLAPKFRFRLSLLIYSPTERQNNILDRPLEKTLSAP